MSTNESPRMRVAGAVAALLLAITALISAGLLLQEYGPGNMGNGFLVGAGVTILAAVFAGYRILHHPGSTTTIERAWTSTGDERDSAVLTGALAVVGFTAPLLVGVATIILAIGAPMAPVLAILNFTFIAVFAVAFAVTARRN